MSIVEVRVCGRYKLGPKIGQGSFGNIYLARNVQTNQEVAIKAEEIKSKHPQLLYEGKIFQGLQGGIGIPSMHWCGQEGDFNFLVMELMGQNLEEMFILCGRRFRLKTVLMIADQLISNLEYIHYKQYIHRDIKPENFVVGLGKKSRYIHTIDFGLAKKYRDIRTQEHIPFRDKKPLIGTARYASLNAHQGFEVSRRDDMESLMYILIYFLRGQLPWQGIQALKKEDKYFKIKEKKSSITVEDLCQGLPPEFEIYLNYIRKLKFDEKVDYTYLKKILKERFVKEGYEFDYVYDWVLIPLSHRNPLIAAKIPITIELLNNEDELIKPLEDSNGSHELEKDFSPREDEDIQIQVQQQQIMLQQQQRLNEQQQYRQMQDNILIGNDQNQINQKKSQQNLQLQQQQQQLSHQQQQHSQAMQQGQQNQQLQARINSQPDTVIKDDKKKKKDNCQIF